MLKGLRLIGFVILGTLALNLIVGVLHWIVGGADFLLGEAVGFLQDRLPIYVWVLIGVVGVAILAKTDTERSSCLGWLGLIGVVILGTLALNLIAGVLNWIVGGVDFLLDAVVGLLPIYVWVLVGAAFLLTFLLWAMLRRK